MPPVPPECKRSLRAPATPLSAGEILRTIMVAHCQAGIGAREVFRVWEEKRCGHYQQRTTRQLLLKGENFFKPCHSSADRHSSPTAARESVNALRSARTTISINH